MKTMNLEIRQARPEDADAAVDLIYSAAPDAYEFLYAIKGGKARDYIRYEFARGTGFLGAAAHTVAVVDGQVVGTGSFYTKATHKTLGSEQARNFIARFGLWEFIRMMPRGLRIQRGISKLEEGQLYVANLGVKADMRSKGIGKALIEAAAQQAGAQGLAQVVLDVSEQNPRAEALYQRLGFNVTGVNRRANKPGGVQLPNAKSMCRKIG
jgi:ribosomal protein S18 acetylase RimI-like enzyme